MADVGGSWDCVMKTRMGPQDSVLVINRDGDTFTGNNSGPMGSVDITDGKIDGDTLTWTMAVTKPIALKLSGVATVAGDAISGVVDGGMLAGKMALTGKRKA